MGLRPTFLLMLLMMGMSLNATHAREPPHPIVKSYKVQRVQIYLTALWVPKSVTETGVVDAEFFLVSAEVATACKGETRSQCAQLKAQGTQARKVRTGVPRKKWNFGREFDEMMAVFKKEARSDYKERLYAWVVDKIPPEEFGNYPVRPWSSVDPYGTRGFELPFLLVEPIDAVILEVVYIDIGGISDVKSVREYVLDLKL